LDPYDFFLIALGAAILLAAALPRVVHRRPLSIPIVQLGLGAVVYLLVDALEKPNPLRDDALAERLAEFVVIISLTSAGLKLDRRVGWRTWAPTWRLLALTMPLTIGVAALLGWGLLGLGAAGAVLLGAVVAPTDPVLASDVQVAGPNEGDDEREEVRTTLTGEAGLNDALAFPFTNLAIAIAAGGAWFGPWLLDDVIIKLTVGLVMGILLGRAVAWLAFRGPATTRLAQTSEGIAALGATLFVYGITEAVHGYGFLAVFVAAVVLRDQERDAEYHQWMHESADTIERIGSALLLMLLGGAVAGGALSSLGIKGVVVAVLLVVLVRPVLAYGALAGSRLSRPERIVIAVFGIRGMGSVYYLAHAANQESFPDIELIWAVVLLTIVLSVVIHGVSASMAMAWVDQSRDLDDR
jgi:sodium/hydrogen antiporter